MRTEALKFQTIGSPAIIIIQWRIWSEEEREVRIPFLLSFDSLKEREGEVTESKSGDEIEEQTCSLVSPSLETTFAVSSINDRSLRSDGMVTTIPPPTARPISGCEPPCHRFVSRSDLRFSESLPLVAAPRPDFVNSNCEKKTFT
jgi:hypothetical protein